MTPEELGKMISDENGLLLEAHAAKNEILSAVVVKYDSVLLVHPWGYRRRKLDRLRGDEGKLGKMTITPEEIIDPDPWRVGKLADELLVEEFVAVVLNGLETGSYGEALADELVERFQKEIQQ